MNVKLENFEVCTNCKQVYTNRCKELNKLCCEEKTNIVSIFDYIKNSKYKG